MLCSRIIRPQLNSHLPQVMWHAGSRWGATSCTSRPLWYIPATAPSRRIAANSHGECPPQVKCCLNVLGCPNVRVSCELADLPEEEQSMSVRQFHGQQCTLISVDIGGIQTKANQELQECPLSKEWLYIKSNS